MMDSETCHHAKHTNTSVCCRQTLEGVTSVRSQCLNKGMTTMSYSHNSLTPDNTKGISMNAPFIRNYIVARYTLVSKPRAIN